MATYVDIAMHSVFAQQIDSKFFSGLGEPEKAVQGNDKSEDPGSLVMMDQIQELFCYILIRIFALFCLRKDSIFCLAIIVVQSFMLMVQSPIQDLPPNTFRCEHPGDKWLKVHIAMIELVGNGSDELYFIGLETVASGVSIDWDCIGLHLTTHLYLSTPWSSLAFVPVRRPITGL